MPKVRIAALVVLGLRVLYGAALLLVPARVTRRWLGPAGAEPPASVAVRGVGAREIAVHGAAMVAAVRGEPLRPWLAISIAGDLADIGATAAGRDGVPDGAPLATLAVAGGSALLSAAVAAAADA
jgi:hypothetical protein